LGIELAIPKQLPRLYGMWIHVDTLFVGNPLCPEPICSPIPLGVSPIPIRNVSGRESVGIPHLYGPASVDDADNRTGFAGAVDQTYRFSTSICVNLQPRRRLCCSGMVV